MEACNVKRAHAAGAIMKAVVKIDSLAAALREPKAENKE